ncbi:hypothetical protein FLA105534_00256 [Flavobacterium bizetiae]|uniref:SusD-like protein P2 n=1 Tax=Flavobacterium bizetiae TaxID=2704140 RepID=A0A6J4G6T4_9FLAO|nr:RagB/SusD family nutrient uptake outer membrane protein [Flavobacterium bizetiae]CAA9194666.1 hypothetical protein FLA105534_00256 [Flavobacterium bizetiae]CAD5343611.1 hypothetical protein FLA105535_03611 [Flavobacterium bizetiae]CAD5347804.1 hypothetical protein FLA105534_01763 [Flavobacterium bizetiae]
MKTITLIPFHLRSTSLAILCATATLLLVSCDSFVEVDLPKSQLTNKTVFENYQTADAALADLYAKIRDAGLLTGNSSGLCNQLGNYTDELTYFGSATDPTLYFYNNSLLATNTAIAQLWNFTYNQIYAANAILEGSRNSSGLSTAEKKQLAGEALFIRALLHFYLVNLFGDLPYVTTTDYKTNSSIGKLSVEDIYRLVETDLSDAALLLPPTPLNDTRVRVQRTAVFALQARVYLYGGRWAEAANSASAVLNETGLYRLEGIYTVFLKDSKETIWQLQPSPAGKNTDQAITFIFFTGPPASVSLSPALMDSFGTDDLRKTHWTARVSKGTSAWYHAFKYKQNNATASSVEYSIVLRLAEQYLIRAEARAHQGDIIGSREDLNEIRHRAGLADTSALSSEELLEAIQGERRWEFFTEYGHRFFDLKRSGNLDKVLSGVKSGWNSTDVLFPLPQAELSLNPKLLPQNKGY